MQSHKYFYVSIGLILIIIASIKFYNQAHPPKLKIIRNIYCFLHGADISDDSNWYRSDRYGYSATKMSEGFHYFLDYVSFENNESKLSFTVKPIGIETKSINETSNGKTVTETHQKELAEPFPDPVISKNSNPYVLTRKDVSSSNNGVMHIDLFFPEFNRRSGDLDIFSNYKLYEKLFTLSCPRDGSVEHGSPIWFITFTIGTFFIILGVRSNHSRTIKKEIGKSVRNLDAVKNDVLRSIEGWSSYSSLSLKDKYRYDSAVSFLDNSQSIVLSFYKNQILYPNSPFLNVFNTVLLLIVLSLFAYVIYTVVQILFPDIMELSHHFFISYENPISDILSDRITRLENSRKSLKSLLLIMFFIGILAILINYFSGLFYAKYIVQRETKKKLALIHEKINLIANKKSMTVENQIIALQNSLNGIDSALFSSFQNIDSLAKEYSQKFGKEIKQDIKGLYKTLKCIEKKLKKDLTVQIRK